mgnify:CR=1 FL=1|tara:strand:+ start:206 stop:427 length:222 start_codon:yes stop_codon:yes gene_type:complete
MNFNIHHIGGEYTEMKVDAIETGTMDSLEAAQLAGEMLDAASELLSASNIDWASNACGAISEGLSEHIALLHT